MITEPPGEPHGNQFELAGADVLTVQPDPGRAELLEPFAGVLGEVNHVRDLGVASVARRAAGELRVPDAVTPLAVEGLVLELLALAARLRKASALGTERRPPRWLGEARALLHDRFRENLRLADIATEVGVHPVHLARVFRLSYGTPARGLRARAAAHLGRRAATGFRRRHRADRAGKRGSSTRATSPARSSSTLADAPRLPP